MNKKDFLVKIWTGVVIPYNEEDHLHNPVNKNHLMYQAQAYLNEHPELLETHRLKYEYEPTSS